MKCTDEISEEMNQTNTTNCVMWGNDEIDILKEN